MLLLGVDIGTASSKAVVTTEDGSIVASGVRPHATSSPRPGWFEHDPEAIWWGDTCSLVKQLLEQVPAGDIGAACVSGIGPCALVADEQGRPLRPAILYGIDVRAEREIDDLAESLGEKALLERCGNRLTTQSVGPKLAWLQRCEPEVWRHTRRWFSASSFVLHRLTGEYVVDRYTASASEPLFDLQAATWWDDGWAAVAPRLERPRLAWPAEIAGTVSRQAADAVGLVPGTPVLAGTIDALSEALSAGSRAVGDTMVMYGSTMFLIQTVAKTVVHPGLWANAGLTDATFSLAAGMATSGLITTWFAEAVSRDVPGLLEEAIGVPPGSGGLLLLPYFQGERTPIFDPQARGCWLGLALQHTRAHMYRSILEGVAFGVRHNLETMVEAGAVPRRLVAVGGGTRGDLWTQIVSDVTGMPQDLPAIVVGAAYGDARMAAGAMGMDTSAWNPIGNVIKPAAATAAVYDDLYSVYRRVYPALGDDMHRLAGLQAGDRSPDGAASCP